MIAKDFEFYRPTELSEALSLLGQDLGDVRVLAGGMSLIPAMNLGLVRPDAVVSLNHVKSLDAVVEDGGDLRLGALVRHRRMEMDGRIRAACPLLTEAAGLIADVQVRHRGTIGGSLVHADPAANYVPVMLALAARFRLASRTGERWVHAGAFFQGALETNLDPGEVLAEILVPVETATQCSAYYQLTRVHGSFAIANAAAVVDSDAGVRVVIGGATAKPIVVEERLSDRVGSSTQLIDRIGDVVHDVCNEPLEDLYGSAEYRRSMARVVARRAVAEALRRRDASRTEERS
jgi:aerobic carbon-monoxide dehydrogenase medium subunit